MDRETILTLKAALAIWANSPQARLEEQLDGDYTTLALYAGSRRLAVLVDAHFPDSAKEQTNDPSHARQPIRLNEAELTSLSLPANRKKGQ
jgi:hypothetical protein